MPARVASTTSRLDIKVNGSSLVKSDSKVMADLLNFRITEDIDVPGMFELELVSQDAQSGELTWVDQALFNVGNEVEICMGNDESLETMILGEITGLEPEFDMEEAPRLVVRGHDLRHRMMRGQKTRTFAEMKDSAIANQIAQEAGLRAKVKDTGVTLSYVLQHNQTDWEFLQNRAQRIGYEVAIDGKTLYFQPYRYATPGILTLTYGEDLLRFSPRLSTMNQTAQVEVRGWDARSKQAVVSQVKADQLRSPMGKEASGPQNATQTFGTNSHVIVTEPVFSAAEAGQIATGQLEAMALGYITGEGECQGNHQVRAGRVIKIAGIGERFSGLYYATSVTHTYKPDGDYNTQFAVRRNAT